MKSANTIDKDRIPEEQLEGALANVTGGVDDLREELGVNLCLVILF